MSLILLTVATEMLFLGLNQILLKDIVLILFKLNNKPGTHCQTATKIEKSPNGIQRLGDFRQDDIFNSQQTDKMHFKTSLHVTEAKQRARCDKCRLAEFFKENVVLPLPSLRANRKQVTQMLFSLTGELFRLTRVILI